MSVSCQAILVSGAFDDLRSSHVRFLQEAARLGAVHVLLWPDDAVTLLEGSAPKFPEAERRYFLSSLRFVASVETASGIADTDTLPSLPALPGCAWAVMQKDASPEKQAYCRQAGLEYCVIPDAALAGFPPIVPAPLLKSSRKQVLVTGTFDWLHTGHIRFFEEAASYGDLTVIVGHNENIKLLKGEGHPLFNQDERLYMVSAIRWVSRALLSTGHGWLDAEPELERLKPDIYAVNDDGDKLEKRAYCHEHGIRYLVLKRTPKKGLPHRSSTKLRGF